MKASSYTLLYIIGLVFCVCSCQERMVYDHYEHTEVNGWQRNDTLRFDIPPQKGGTYQLNIGLRATALYPFKDICLLMERTLLPKGITRKDTIRCRIFDDNGLTAGKDGISNQELRYHIATIDIQENDSVHLTVRHCMRRESLPGIMGVGIELTR